ncbi:MAG: hypothetical protein WBA10_11930, partial [Elainellaceae cyanobacterium]
MPSTSRPEYVHFLIGEKGTGKTAYAVFLTNNSYKNTISNLAYIRETEYRKFVYLKRNRQLDLTDYVSIWKVILLLLVSKHISERKVELDHIPLRKQMRLNAVIKAVDDYYYG